MATVDGQAGPLLLTVSKFPSCVLPLSCPLCKLPLKCITRVCLRRSILPLFFWFGLPPSGSHLELAFFETASRFSCQTYLSRLPVWKYNTNAPTPYFGLIASIIRFARRCSFWHLHRKTSPSQTLCLPMYLRIAAATTASTTKCLPPLLLPPLELVARERGGALVPFQRERERRLRRRQSGRYKLVLVARHQA